MERVRHKWVAVLLLGLLLASTGSFSQVREVKSFDRDVQLTIHENLLEMSLAFPEVFTKRLRSRLSNGFTSLFLVDIQLNADGIEEAVAQGLVQYTVLYDIWEESFMVRKEGLAQRQELTVKSMDDLVKSCAALERLPVTQLVGLPRGRKYRIRVRITVNPTSLELRNKVREYLANPDGRGHIGSPRSFFGSFSRIFVNEKELQADAIYTYRSQRFDLPAGQ